MGTVAEAIQSPEVDRARSGGINIIYNALDFDDDDAAHDAVWALAPATKDGFKKSSTLIRSIESASGRDYVVTVRYKILGITPLKETGYNTYNFDVSARTMRKYWNDPANVTAYPPDGKTCPTAEEMKGAIGINGENVEGVDIDVPCFNFTLTEYPAIALVDDTYKGILFAKEGHTNSDAFFGCQPGECRYLGTTGNQRSEDDYELTHRFEASPNVTGLVVGTVTGIAKKGFQYIDVLYTDGNFSDAGDRKIKLKLILGVYVHSLPEYSEVAFAPILLTSWA